MKSFPVNTSVTIEKSEELPCVTREICTETSPQCCWVVRAWQLMGKNTTVDPNITNGCCSMAGVTCNADLGTVTKIIWRQMALSGPIPFELGNLINLNWL